MLRWIKIFIAILAITICNKSISQDFTSKMLFVNQNKLYSESIFGKSLESLFKEESSKLAVENKNLTKKLQLEEQILTEKREITSSKDFKFLAEEFNFRVEKVRKEQKDKASLLNTSLEHERKHFFKIVYPILLKFVVENGAYGILDSSVFIVANQSLDITDRLISIINKEVTEVPLMKTERKN
ncbi:MAG: OmpH family outer membrane protein [Paracoccaceae bacterium]